MGPSPIKKARTGSAPSRKTTTPRNPSTPSTISENTAEPRDESFSPFASSYTSASSRLMARPHSFSASDAAAASILSRVHDDIPGKVTTLRLPRASVSSASPARSGSTPGSWSSSMEVSAPSLSTDTRPLPPGLQMLHGIGVIELLEHDTRPTFLIDLANPTSATLPSLHILYYNTALRACPEILHLLTAAHDDASTIATHKAFTTWISTSQKSPEGSELLMGPHSYGGITWTCSTIRRRFRFVSGNANFTHVTNASPMVPDTRLGNIDERSRTTYPSRPPTPITAAEPLDPPDYFADATRRTSLDEDSLNLAADGRMSEDGRRHPDDFTNQVLKAQPTMASFDWTRLSLTDDLPEHFRFAKSVDWEATALGPMEEWSNDLRVLSNLVMGSPHPASIYWGPEFVTIYNEAYIELAGQKHPKLMGMSYYDAWPEIWVEISPIFKSAWESGQATMKQENQLFLNRNGFLEETFFSWSIVPLVGSDGQVFGLYNPAFENTRRRINERRMLTLREVGERTATATSVDGFWPQVQKGLEFNEWDVPFGLLYSVKDDAGSDVSSLHSGSHMPHSQLVLESSLGVPEDHPANPEFLDLHTSTDGFAPHMRQSLTVGNNLIVLSADDGTLPESLVHGMNHRGFGDQCTKVVVIPVIPTTALEAVAGFIIIGVNPRRPYDDDYQLFIHLLSRQLATSLASVVLFEDEIKRGQRAARLAALDRQELSMQLILRTQEASESEYKFSRMAEFAPVGMFIADSNGLIIYCNEMWWQISRHPRTEESQDTWMDSVRAEDRPALEDAWNNLLMHKMTVSVEFRFKCSQRNGDNTIDTWALMSAFPEQTQEGQLKSIFGCITDISSQKWAEKVQNGRREEAVEMKRQQENFIDITSHEMRNPLSAILQCADQIADNISAHMENSSEEQVEALLDGCLDAANTINLCASHQKRIVDDILTLSKLDSNLLTVTPVDEQPVRVVQRALKMFEAELVAHDIEFEFRVDSTFEKYKLKWAKLDPSRLRQVLINLMTNAIKFTQGREKRGITVSLVASKDISEVTSKGTHYFERNDGQRWPSAAVEDVEQWGEGERFNIHCSVEDTGPGLGDEELKLLFQRFQQATPRTHVQYGGSGLGLFISRILTEMQGGQIGVTSSQGTGSKFSFYIQCRQSEDPPVDYEHIQPYKIIRKSQSPTIKPKPSETLPKSPQPKKAAVLGQTSLYDVLIVEDNLVNQKVLQRQLRNCGNNTFVANHGQEALQTIERSRYWAGKEAEGVDISVILMDLEMPVMDGMTCARRIRELELEGTIVQHIPIIAVTAYARPEQIADAKAAGIDDVISKPFRIPELIPKIEELVSKYKNLSFSPEK